MQSIFTDVGKQSLQDPSNSAVLPGFVGQAGSPLTSTAWLSQSGEGHYALASPAGGIVILTLPPHDAQGGERLPAAPVLLPGSWPLPPCSFLLSVSGGVSILELKRSSMMQRLSGWMPTAIRGEHSPCDLVLSLAVRELEEDAFLFALCQDHKLRMWSLRVRMNGRVLGHRPGRAGATGGPAQGGAGSHQGPRAYHIRASLEQDGR